MAVQTGDPKDERLVDYLVDRLDSWWVVQMVDSMVESLD